MNIYYIYIVCTLYIHWYILYKYVNNIHYILIYIQYVLYTIYIIYTHIYIVYPIYVL